MFTFLREIPGPDTQFAAKWAPKNYLTYHSKRGRALPRAADAGGGGEAREREATERRAGAASGGVHHAGYVFGVGEVAADAGFWETLRVRSYHLFLPLLCWTYPSLAFLSRQMRGGMLTVLRQDFIRTARAKGLEEKKIIWKHAFRNSLLPIITLFAGVFPRMISGSIAIEVIFSIPGMGSTMLSAIDAKDFPLVFTIVMFSAILTIIGYLIADILYAVVDPRITYK